MIQQLCIGNAEKKPEETFKKLQLRAKRKEIRMQSSKWRQKTEKIANSVNNSGKQ